MIRFIIVFSCFLLMISCETKQNRNPVKPINWENRAVQLTPRDSLERGSTYLSAYSQIYCHTDNRTHDLTATVSLRNTSKHDSVYVLSATYYDTHGKLIKTYFDHPVYIAPLETVEIVINEKENKGGTGANFIFDWAKKPNSTNPLFEAVMISTSGQQGLSFTTKGEKI